ncbi:MAG: hypothetical protein ACFFCO_07375 [Promethearchaeota archaeon]
MRWNAFLLYLIILLILSPSVAFLGAFLTGWTVTNFATHLFIAGCGLIILGTCFSVRLCDEVVYTHRPINPALVRDVEEYPIHRGYGIGEAELAFLAARGILLALATLLFLPILLLLA